MPLREFSCDRCQHRFEDLVSEGEKTACPECGGKKVTRRLSAFAVASSTPARSRGSEPGDCGSCGDPRGPGSCSMN